MSVRASATRYARALLDVVIAERIDPEQVERQLMSLAELFAQHPDLQRVLVNPVVPTAGKRGVMQELANRLGVATPVAKLLLLLADRDRLALLPDLVAVYRERLLEHLQVVRADVTTAMPLDAGKAVQLERRLADLTGRRVTVTTTVDPSIIGGVVTRIGSTIYDGSVATQLETMKQRLVEQA